MSIVHSCVIYPYFWKKTNLVFATLTVRCHLVLYSHRIHVSKNICKPYTDSEKKTILTLCAGLVLFFIDNSVEVTPIILKFSLIELRKWRSIGQFILIIMIVKTHVTALSSLAFLLKRLNVWMDYIYTMSNGS